jgi:hypothetical protein
LKEYKTPALVTAASPILGRELGKYSDGTSFEARAAKFVAFVNRLNGFERKLQTFCSNGPRLMAHQTAIQLVDGPLIWGPTLHEVTRVGETELRFITKPVKAMTRIVTSCLYIIAPNHLLVAEMPVVYDTDAQNGFLSFGLRLTIS